MQKFNERTYGNLISLFWENVDDMRKNCLGQKERWTDRMIRSVVKDRER